MTKKILRDSYQFTITPGHGYLHVPMRDIIMLGIGKDITPYSYQNATGTMAYLEEDLDAGTFIDAWENNTGRKIQLRYVHNDSPRYYYGYQRPGGRKLHKLYVYETGEVIADGIEDFQEAATILQNKAEEDWGGFVFDIVGGVGCISPPEDQHELQLHWMVGVYTVYDD